MQAAVVTAERTESVSSARSSARLRHVAESVAAALLVFAGCLSLQLLAASLRFHPAHVTPVWFPGGFLLAIFLLLPPRRWWPLLPFAFAGLYAGVLSTPVSFAGNVVRFFVLIGPELLAAAVLRRVLPAPSRLGTLRHAVLFLLVAGVGAPTLTALVLAGVYQFLPIRSPYGTAARAIFLAAALGNLTLTAPALALARSFAGHGFKLWTRVPLVRVGEAITLGVLLLLVGEIAFGDVLPGLGPSPALVYAPLPLLLWAAVRFGPAGVGLAVVPVAILATWNSLHGHGPFIAGSVDANILTLQVFLFAMLVPLLVLAALMQERTDSEVALRASEGELRRRFAQLSAAYRDAPVGLAFVDRDLRYAGVNDRFAALGGEGAAALVGRPVRELLVGMADEIEARYRRVFSTGEPNVDVALHGGTVAQPDLMHDWVINHQPVRDERGEIVGVSTVVQDVTERKRAETEIRALLTDQANRVRELTALHGAARILQDDARTIEEWLHAFAVLVPPACRSHEVASARICWGDLEAATPGFRETPWAIRSAFTTGNGAAGRVDGSIEVVYREERPAADDGPFRIEERRLLDALAEMLRGAIERRVAEEARNESYARIRDLSRRLTDVEEAERAHLARELHDEVGQSLTRIKMVLTAARAAPSGASDPARLGTAVETVDDLIHRVRQISIELRPPHLDLLGLLPTLSWHLQRYTEQTGIRVALRHRDLDRRFDPRVELAAFRIVQEALTNVARHSRAREATVRVLAADASLFLQIEDAGIGFDPAAPRGHAAGVAGMEERALLLGGTLIVESTPDQGGTIIRAELPFGDPSGASERSWDGQVEGGAS